MHRLATRTVLQHCSIEPTFLLLLLCGNDLHSVDFQNLTAKVPSMRSSHRHPVGTRGRTDIQSKRLEIPFCDMALEEIVPSMFAKHKPTSPCLVLSS
jgi:hypothetical protein